MSKKTITKKKPDKKPDARNRLRTDLRPDYLCTTMEAKKILKHIDTYFWL